MGQEGHVAWFALAEGIVQRATVVSEMEIYPQESMLRSQQAGHHRHFLKIERKRLRVRSSSKHIQYIYLPPASTNPQRLRMLACAALTNRHMQPSPAQPSSAQPALPALLRTALLHPVQRCPDSSGPSCPALPGHLLTPVAVMKRRLPVPRRRGQAVPKAWPGRHEAPVPRNLKNSAASFKAFPGKPA